MSQLWPTAARYFFRKEEKKKRHVQDDSNRQQSRVFKKEMFLNWDDTHIKGRSCWCWPNQAWEKQPLQETTLLRQRNLDSTSRARTEAESLEATSSLVHQEFMRKWRERGGNDGSDYGLRSDYELWRELCGFAKKLVSPFPKRLVFDEHCGIQCAPGADSMRAEWEGILLQTRCQGKMTDSSYCQDPGGPHSKANCKRRGGSFKAMGTENNLCVHWQSFSWKMDTWLIAWNSVNVPMSPDKQRLNLGPWTGCTCNSHHPCVPSFLGAWWTQASQQTDPSSSESPSHPKTMQDAPRSLGARKNSIR